MSYPFNTSGFNGSTELAEVREFNGSIEFTEIRTGK
jgi:hypothetical protein